MADLPQVPGLLSPPEGLAHPGDQGLPEKKKNKWAQQTPRCSLHTPWFPGPGETERRSGEETGVGRKDAREEEGEGEEKEGCEGGRGGGGGGGWRREGEEGGRLKRGEEGRGGMGGTLTVSPFSPFSPGAPFTPKSPLPPWDTGHAGEAGGGDICGGALLAPTRPPQAPGESAESAGHRACFGTGAPVPGSRARLDGNGTGHLGTGHLRGPRLWCGRDCAHPAAATLSTQH